MPDTQDNIKSVDDQDEKPKRQQNKWSTQDQ